MKAISGSAIALLRSLMIGKKRAFTGTGLMCFLLIVHSFQMLASVENLARLTTAPLLTTMTSPISNISKLVSVACHDPAVNFLEVVSPASSKSAKRHMAQPTKKRNRILCFVLTTEKQHATKVSAIRDTWGRKCDKLVIASNRNDPSIGAVAIDSNVGYWGIWDKLIKTLEYLLREYDNDDHSYDWIYKADDDTYAIMENLREFLANETLHSEQLLLGSGKNASVARPVVYGRPMPWPILRELKYLNGWFGKKKNRKFGWRFFEKFSENETLVYSHGGPGYVMNWEYVRQLVRAYNSPEPESVHGRISEDLANAVTMMYRDVYPTSTTDPLSGRERFHPEPPQVMFRNPSWLAEVQYNLQNIGSGEDCCSPRSIAFHHMSPSAMRLLDYQLYECPRTSAK